MLNVTPNTMCLSSDEIIPAVLHTGKGHLMSTLRTSPVAKTDILLVKVYEEAPDACITSHFFE